MKLVHWRPNRSDQLCSKHFSDDCFVKFEKRTTLKRGSIPTIFCSSMNNIRDEYNADAFNRKRGMFSSYMVRFDKVIEPVDENYDTYVDDMFEEPCEESSTEEPSQMEENEAQFSWEKPSLMCNVSDVLSTAQLVPDPPLTSLLVKEEPVFITCNLCGENIVGCRFTCCECELDACACCETKHASHLMLRVPPAASPEEALAAVEAVRCRLALLRGTSYVDPFKVEVKPDPDAELEIEETTNMEPLNTHTEVLYKSENDGPNVKELQRDNSKYNKAPEAKIECIDIDAQRIKESRDTQKVLNPKPLKQVANVQKGIRLAKIEIDNVTLKILEKDPQAIKIMNVGPSGVLAMVSEKICVGNDFHIHDPLAFTKKNTNEIEGALNTENNDHQYSRKRMRRSEEPNPSCTQKKSL